MNAYSFYNPIYPLKQSRFFDLGCFLSTEKSLIFSHFAYVKI